MYRIDLSPEAIEDTQKLQKSEKQAYKKFEKLLQEMRIHPYTGTGHPKPLGKNKSGLWSRRITDKHRLIYEVNDDIITVFILSIYGHYGDK